MLGPARCRFVDERVTVSLDDLVPLDHFYRHLDAHLNLSFICNWVADAYPGIGRPSVDPVVVFKFYLVMVFEGMRTPSVDDQERWLADSTLDGMALRREVLRAAREGRLHELVPLAGQAVGLINAILPVTDIIRRLLEETDTALTQVGQPHMPAR